MAALNESVTVTKSCAKRIKALQKSAHNDQLVLRVMVESGGCSGFQYVFKMETPDLSEEDKIFERDGAKVVVDAGSLDLIKGATIDFEQELIRSAFAVTNNPQSETACGCGSSFAIKNFAANPATH
jgi:iron-sulfur cluster assembly accessory protein